MTDYLVHLRREAYQRRLAHSARLGIRGKESEKGMGGYGQMNPFEDMMDTITRLFSERAIQAHVQIERQQAEMYAGEDQYDQIPEGPADEAGSQEQGESSSPTILKRMILMFSVSWTGVE